MVKANLSATLSARPVLRKRQGPSYAEMHGEEEFGQPNYEELLKLQKEVRSSPKYPSFKEKFLAIWAEHEVASLPLHHESGKLILQMKKEMADDPARGRALLSVVAEELGRSVSDGSREVAFATRWATFEDFQKEQADVKTWSQLKVRLAELSRAEKPESNGNGKPKTITAKQRAALIERFKGFREAISEVKDDLSVKELAEVEGTVEGIFADLEELAAPLKKLAKHPAS